MGKGVGSSIIAKTHIERGSAISVVHMMASIFGNLPVSGRRFLKQWSYPTNCIVNG